MIVCLASGSGSNFEALSRAFPHHMCGVISNVATAGVLKRASRLGVASKSIPHGTFSSRGDFESHLVKEISDFSPVKLIVLAGFMRVLSPIFFLQKTLQLPNVTIVNLHPAHLPDYKGAKAFEYAVDQKYPRWGLTVHEVIPALDSGSVISSCEIPLFPWETVEEFSKRASVFEHRLLVSAVGSILKITPGECHDPQSAFV